MANVAVGKPLQRKNLLAMVCLLSFLGLNCPSSRLQAEEITQNIVGQISNKTFKIRMSSYFQIQVSGRRRGYYVFEAARDNSDDWQVVLKTPEEVGNIFQDTPTIAKSREHMELISENVGYVVAGRELIATADGGQSWKPVDLSSYFSEPMISKDAYIGEIVIYKNGRGTLTICEEYPHRSISGVKTLYTFDFGQSWTERPML